MTPCHVAVQQVPRHPPPLVVELCLMRQRPRRIGSAQVLGLDQLGLGLDVADRGHRQSGAIDLIQESRPEAALVGPVRIPVPVKSRETRCRQRLVDRRPRRDPRIASRGFSGVGREARGEVRIQKVGIDGSAAVMQQPGDGAHARAPDSRQPSVRPSPVKRSG